MTWTAPRTWVADEVVTDTMLNAHLRDNELVLKVTRDAVGRLSELSSTTLADLSSTNVTGLARPAQANTFTGGRTRFQGTSRLVVPVGADKWTGTKGVDARGIWVEGDYLHHISSNFTTEWRYLGELVSHQAAALSGSLWNEGDYLHYVDEDEDERRCLSLGSASPHTDAGAIGASLWVETYQHWIRESGQVEKPGHADQAHVDGTQHDDAHGDTPHQDAHTNEGHGDDHTNTHGDTSHADAYTDHDDGFHQDNHFDIPGHNDSHDDHTNSPHQDDHDDVNHNDTAHTDHSDHGDVPTYNQPVVV